MPSTLQTLMDSLPPYADDLRLNLNTVLRQTELTPQQLWGTAVASAAASRHRGLLDAILEEAAATINSEIIDASLAAHAVMAMNNVYFRFVHLVEHSPYAAIPSHLRMNITRRHGAPPADFELWCLAVSAINGCAVCMQSHDRSARDKGASEEMVLAAVRIASVIHAVACVLDAA